jgi:hypothetical protein
MLTAFFSVQERALVAQPTPSAEVRFLALPAHRGDLEGQLSRMLTGGSARSSANSGRWLNDCRRRSSAAGDIRRNRLNVADCLTTAVRQICSGG